MDNHKLHSNTGELDYKTNPGMSAFEPDYSDMKKKTIESRRAIRERDKQEQTERKRMEGIFSGTGLI